MTIMMMLAAMVGAEQPAQAVDENVLKLAQENAAFAFELYAQLKTQEGNLLYSPYSISSALALAYGGARGETEHQMAKTLHFTLPQDSLHPAFSALGTYFKRLSDGQKLTLNIANSLWLDQSFSVLSAYQALTQTYYGAALAQVDYLKQAEKARTQINGWVAEQTSAQRVSVSLPKFSARFRVDVIETLAQLGLTSLADFSGMAAQAAHLSNVIHEAFIEVNEQGSEAAAATAVAMGRGIARPPVEFRADHPFVFFIVDTETGSVLFVGRIVNPAA